jgi:hypothetical protein
MARLDRATTVATVVRPQAAASHPVAVAVVRVLLALLVLLALAVMVVPEARQASQGHRSPVLAVVAVGCISIQQARLVAVDQAGAAREAPTTLRQAHPAPPIRAAAVVVVRSITLAPVMAAPGGRAWS